MDYIRRTKGEQVGVIKDHIPARSNGRVRESLEKLDNELEFRKALAKSDGIAYLDHDDIPEARINLGNKNLH